MLIKLLMDFSRWVWGLEPLTAPDNLTEPWMLTIAFSALVDVGFLAFAIMLIVDNFKSISKFFSDICKRNSEKNDKK